MKSGDCSCQLPRPKDRGAGTGKRGVNDKLVYFAGLIDTLARLADDLLPVTGTKLFI